MKVTVFHCPLIGSGTFPYPGVYVIWSLIADDSYCTIFGPKTLKNAQWHKVPYGTSQTRIKWFLFFIFFTNIISINQNKRRLWSIPNALTVILKAVTVETKWSIQAVLQLARPQVKSSQTRNCCLFGTVNLFISQCGGKQTTPVVQSSLICRRWLRTGTTVKRWALTCFLASCSKLFSRSTSERRLPV